MRAARARQAWQAGSNGETCFFLSSESLLCPANLAAAAVFDCVHAGIGGTDDGVERGAVGRCGGDADAGADGESKTAFHAEVSMEQRVVQLRSLGEGGWRCGAGHEQNEFIAAVAEALVLRAGELLQARGDFGE